ncbi:DUF3616 domain-containing protein [Fluviibacterium sp. DFM31]|uniref:DUF3616 domain-containing protein n=1 Tax=Meridianimarinicoccus marinus TaxID=3231483 RepID=A0ABV3L1P3_9RHOB
MPDTDLPEPSATRLVLSFKPPAHPKVSDEAVRQDLSAVVRRGKTLMLACDETAGVELLHWTGDTWGDHAHVDLSDWVDLPEGDGEMDIEGLEIAGNWLWITGSHSLKRGKPDGKTGAKGLKAMSKITWDRNRQFLGRVPLVAGPEGRVLPVARDGKRRAQHVAFSKHGALRKWLARDPLLAPFLDLPSKDNGLDVEGIAARGKRVWLGLRGPVLRGQAIVLELHLKVTRKGHLKAQRIDGRKRYRLHALDLGGAGIRDLAFDGDDLLLLTGTTLAGDGRARVYRWPGAVQARAAGTHGPMAVALSLPYAAASDNPEGLARYDDDTWLIVHDSPETARTPEGSADFLADLWHLTG